MISGEIIQHPTGGAAKFAKILTYAGAIPFVVFTALLFVDGVDAPLSKSPSTSLNKANVALWLTTYAAVILSFLGGIQWGIGISMSSAAPRSAKTLLCLSVLPSLFAWAMLFITTPTSRILVAIGLFGFVWMVDTLLNLQRIIPPWFYKLRTTITAIVMICLVISIAKT